VTGERHLVLRGENAHAGIRLVRRQDEGRLGKIELQRQRLHSCRVEALRPFEHAQWIARERRAGLREHIDDTISVAGH
jgi:hypothetical protein